MTNAAQQYFSVGHELASNSTEQGMRADFFEIADLTIDCGITASTGTSIAAGAIRIRGSHSRIRRIKAVNWGTKNSSLPCNLSVGCSAQERVNVRDLTVRNNIFSNVLEGVRIKNVVVSANLLPTGYSATAFCYADDGYYFAIATVPRRVMAYCASGDVVLLQGTESAYNGFFALWLSDSGVLAYDVPALSPDGSISSMQRILGFQHLLIEGNTIELADLEGG